MGESVLVGPRTGAGEASKGTELRTSVGEWGGPQRQRTDVWVFQLLHQLLLPAPAPPQSETQCGAGDVLQLGPHPRNLFFVTGRHVSTCLFRL